eukprot:2198588-Rhodomonas_salina.3
MRAVLSYGLVLPAYTAATRCALLRLRMAYAWYAMCGTELAYGATRGESIFGSESQGEGA